MVMNEEDDSNLEENIDFKAQYKTLKKKLKSLLTENESFQNVLKSCQRKLLKASRDKHFLLDRLLEYEKPVFSDSSDGEFTESSDDEKRVDLKRKKSLSSSAGSSKPSTPSSSGGGKKKKPNSSPCSSKIKTEELSKPSSTKQEGPPVPQRQNTPSQKQSIIAPTSQRTELTPPNSQKLETNAQSSQKQTSQSLEKHLTPGLPLVGKVKTEDVPQPITQRQSSLDGHMTPEEVERHLESTRQCESTEVYDGVNSASFLEEHEEDIIPGPQSL